MLNVLKLVVINASGPKQHVAINAGSISITGEASAKTNCPCKACVPYEGIISPPCQYYNNIFSCVNKNVYIETDSYFAIFLLF